MYHVEKPPPHPPLQLDPSTLNLHGHVSRKFTGMYGICLNPVKCPYKVRGLMATGSFSAFYTCSLFAHKDEAETVEIKKHYKSYEVNLYINLFWTTKNNLNNRGFSLHSVVILHIFDVQANFNFTVTVCEHLFFTNVNLESKGKAFCFENGGKI